MRASVELKYSLVRALRRPLFASLIVSLFLFGCHPKPKSWVACYNTEISASELQGFDVIVLDSAYRGDLQRLKAGGATLLAYVSLGEVASHRPWFSQAKAAGLLLEENVNWKGAWKVDVRKPAWRDLVLGQVDGLLARGFDGLFLDTVDSSLQLEKTAGERFVGMGQGIVTLVEAIVERSPKIELMMNGGLALVGPLRGKVQMLAMESTLTDWDFKAGRARWRRPDERRWVTAVLHKAHVANPELRIFTLDYWDPRDFDGIRRIYREQRAAGLVPYVGTIALNRVLLEPSAELRADDKRPLRSAPVGKTR